MSDRRTCRRLRAVPFGVAAVIVLLSAACGSDDDSSASAGNVRPFAEVQADEFVFEADRTNPERGIFRMTTTEPMICAIVWGETEALGRFNNSLAMSGTGIIDHDVFLHGAVPGRTYYFRVEGSTADGTLYQTDVATFTIPESQAAVPTEDADRGDNLALGATVVDVSSEFSDGFAAANAIDDSGTTEWATAGDGDNAYIVLDLGREHDIAGVEFITRSMLDGTAVTETFTVTVETPSPSDRSQQAPLSSRTSPHSTRRPVSFASTSTPRPAATWAPSRSACSHPDACRPRGERHADRHPSQFVTAGECRRETAGFPRRRGGAMPTADCTQAVLDESDETQVVDPDTYSGSAAQPCEPEGEAHA